MRGPHRRRMGRRHCQKRNSERCRNGHLSLMEMQCGRRGTVIQIRGNNGIRRRAYDLGIMPGAIIEPIIGSRERTRVVRVGESRFMISPDVAQNVFVSEIG